MTSINSSTNSDTVSRINRLKMSHHFILRLFSVAEGMVFALLLCAFWSWIRPGHHLEAFAIGLSALALTLWRRHLPLPRIIKERDLLIALEIMRQDSDPSPLQLQSQAQTDQGTSEARSGSSEVFERVFRTYRDQWLRLLGRLSIPLIAALTVFWLRHPSLAGVWQELGRISGEWSKGIILTVLEGSATEGAEPKPIKLSPSSPPTIELIAQNMVQLHAVGFDDLNTIPVVELRTRAEDGAAESLQNFQFLDQANTSGKHNLQVTFTVGTNVELFVTSVDRARPLAILKVRALPIPKVTLSIGGTVKDPWPDEQPLPLQINVQAENPLERVQLVIRSGETTARELVSNVMSEDMKTLNTSYQLIPEPYVQQDLVELEIFAEATDRAIPTPLTGVSEPLRIKVASAYGRYQETLNTLRELKEAVDSTVSKGSKGLAPEVAETAHKAAAQAETSPFFDAVDRMQIGRFVQQVDESVAQGPAEQLLELSQSLNNFLFDHEAMDDRERDRDFFVAARSLSRLLETPRPKRQVRVELVTSQITRFLDAREKRWKLRIDRLPNEFKPAGWARIRDGKPFHAALGRIAELDNQGVMAQTNAALVQLSNTVNDYKTWIEALEEAEDKARAQEEQKRQQGLANAQNQLRELQKRQSEISTRLDRATERTKEELDREWVHARMTQNANARDTKRLEADLRAMAPAAATRIKFAAEAMDKTLEHGNGEKYVEAESFSDLAGRLLRQAESAARESEQDRRQRGRRRRVSGDNYYGQSIEGKNIQIRYEYEVDKRYREQILDDVSRRQVDDEEERGLLDRYLRSVVR